MVKTSPSSLVFSKESNPFNISLAEWTILWWNWLRSIPNDSNPASDLTGELSDAFQYNPKTWFLAGTFGGSAIRNCSMPYGKAIFFPIISCLVSFATHHHLKSEEDLKVGVTNDVDTLQAINLDIDKTIFDKFSDFRVKSEPFDDIIDGMKTRSISDGFWVFLRPLGIGTHRIHFMARNSDFFNEVTYKISVKPLHPT